MAREIYRQGDLLFVKVDRLPKKVNRRVRDGIIKRGELGHTHRLIGGELVECWVYGTGVMRFIVVESVAKIVHEEHGEIVLGKGIWTIVRQREYSLLKRFEYVVE
ncbi:MAG: hypothetical protein QW385_00670 [Thermoproteota archaeon]